MSQLDILAKGGLMLWLLMALSIYAVGVIIFKIWQYKTANIFDRSFIDPVIKEIKQGDRARAFHKLSTIRGPVARIMRVTFECVANRDMSQKSREAEIMRVGSADIRYLESHLRGLEMAAATAPLMGLLGTVLGLITSFAKIGEAGTKVDPTMLAGGIWEALLTTAGGLCVAIPAMGAHYVLDGMVERVRATMKDVSVQILSLEDEFRRNERLRAVEEAKRIEAERKEEAQREREIAREVAPLRERTAPQLPDTLQLLSPNYSKV
jgi:biopolymer transport protein ExbB